MLQSKRLSTNDKLQKFLDQKDYDEDDVDHKTRELQVRDKAHKRLWRASMYGAGPRAKIPKVRNIKKRIESPYKLADSDLPSKENVLESAIPPGAHYDQFRLIQYQTKKSLDDPDRVFYATTSMNDGLIFHPNQPPWYFGRKNKTEPPDNNMFTAAARYGFRGSKNIKQRLTSPFGPPSTTKTEYTPKFLSNGDDTYANEYVPPIVAGKLNSINGMESPKLWPEITEYANGYQYKRLGSSHQYSRETTVTLPSRPSTSMSLSSLIERTNELNETINEYTRIESSGTPMSLSGTTKQLFEDLWKNRVTKTASSALQGTLKRIIPPYEAHTLSDPSDKLKYSGSSAFIVHTQTADELKFRLRMQKSNICIPYEVMWRHVSNTFKTLKGRLKREKTSTGALEDIKILFRDEGIRHNNPSMLDRSSFIKVLIGTTYYETTPSNTIAALFSSLDHLQKNIIRFVNIIVYWSILDKPLDSGIAKIMTVFKLLTEINMDVPMLECALATFCSVCKSDRDRLDMEKLFKDEFRMACYNAAIFTDTDGSSSSSGGSSSSHNSNSGKKTVGFSDTSAGAAIKDQVKAKPKAKSGQVYNISSHYLNEGTFINVLQQCPYITQLFDQLLSNRLAYFYGKDARYEEDEAVYAQNVRNKDFSWIISKNKKNDFDSELENILS